MLGATAGKTLCLPAGWQERKQDIYRRRGQAVRPAKRTANYMYVFTYLRSYVISFVFKAAGNASLKIPTL